ncbi:FUSC family protein [Luteimicrobium subarcticum]|uniref:Fusaric acid resistance family protein n=1 Tax=Luteimicrobium subarcticum TaxID=620910 RepID=A0A2M8WUQ3_9MICO|nr:FUSC family protein [Luteimicrobium subarcticum]PJI94675.1 fusaric acid resistance family protein [Luteimicrobium subarcticum]
MTSSATLPDAPSTPARTAWRSTWRASLVVHPGNADHADLFVALRAGLTVLVAIALAALAGHRDVSGFAALGAIAAVYGRLADPVGRARLVGAAGLLQVAVVATTSAVAWALATHGSATFATWAVPVVLGAVAWLACAGSAALRTGPPGATLPVFAAAAGLLGDPTGAVVAQRTVATVAGALVAVLVVAAVGARTAAGRARARMPLAPALPPVADWQLTAARTGLGALVGAVAAQAVGLGHPGWAAVGATAVLQGTSHTQVVVRALHRGAGTAVGAVLAWAVLDVHLPFWALALVIASLQVVTELIVARHYGIAMLTITPMALLMVSLAGSVDPAQLAGQRAFDTLLGVAVGVLVLLVLPHRAASAA